MRDSGLTIAAGAVSLAELMDGGETICYALRVDDKEILLDEEDLRILGAVIDVMKGARGKTA